MIEHKEVPAIARTAAELMKAEHKRVENAVAGQTLEVMGLSPNDGWKVDLTNGVAFREVEEKKEDEAKAA